MSYAAHRTALRRIRCIPLLRRRAARLAVVAALALPAVALGTPAHAASSCVVNDVAQTGTIITGTPQADVIVCSFVDSATVVDSLGGDDTFILTGTVDGRIRGGDGNDRFALSSTAELSELGDIDGQRDQDGFDLSGKVLGTVRGGQDADRILVYQGATTGPRTDLRGAKGADEIAVEAPVVLHGLIEGVEEDDRITVAGTVASDGTVLGGAGQDDIQVGTNLGVVDGGPDADHCTVAAGNPPVGCDP
ncbi:hypothetical protein [Streptomyces huiliensis]|uniref:hypothetical protein n=1 Tax=Streptomyces huiliensis TaxID=2876027 RepID=UPI001CBC76F1|nr:hypothetical protein [Streptomyces huiliensis]MBZ4318365.1 hypothetical protein [Streptomyces huiliensis]